jgi:hypothetical protein
MKVGYDKSMQKILSKDLIERRKASGAFEVRRVGGTGVRVRTCKSMLGINRYCKPDSLKTAGVKETLKPSSYRRDT